MEPIIDGEPELQVATSSVPVEMKVASNDVVIREIAKNLDVSDLKNFRVVCKNWYENSITTWKKKAFVHIGILGKDPADVVVKKDGRTREKSPEDVVQFLEETCNKDFRNILGEYPFQSFSVTSWRVKTKQEVKEQEIIMENFWKICGQFASYLQLKLSAFCANGSSPRSTNELHCFRPIVRNLGPNVTTVELLSMAVDMSLFRRIFLEGPAHPQVKRLVLSAQVVSHFNFLIKFPNVEELKVSSWLRSGESGSGIAISTLRMIRFSKKRRNICNLRRLDMIETNSQEIGSFVEANLPLNYLTLRLGCGQRGSQDLGPSTFQKCMKYYSKSLETLKLRVSAEWDLTTPPCFPRNIEFGNLQVLELWGYFVDNLNFLKEAPHLRKLRLDLLCNEGKRGEGNSSGNLEPSSKIDRVRNIVKNSGDMRFECLELQELLLDFQLPEESWKTLGRWMPNLKILEAPLDNTTFRLVCAQWPKLRDLGCRLGSDIDIDDDGIIGERDHDGVNVKGRSTILNLNYLESFELEAPCGQGKITDRSAKIGFLKMKYLRNLKVFVSPVQVSEWVEEQLRARVGHVEIFRNCRSENIPWKHLEIPCCKWAAEMKWERNKALKRNKM